MSDELQDEEKWDFQRAERRPPSKKPRAVVSVAFARDDFERVGAAAEALGMKVSEFIRGAALEFAGRHVYHFGSPLVETQAHWSYVPAATSAEGRTDIEGRYLWEKAST